MPWIRPRRSLLVETKSTLSAATAGSAGAYDQPKLPPSKPVSKPLPVSRSSDGIGTPGIVTTTAGVGDAAGSSGIAVGAGSARTGAGSGSGLGEDGGGGAGTASA